MNSLGETIKHLRTEKGLSQQQFADMLYVDRSTCANWETGRRMPDTSMIVNISKVLGVSVEAFKEEFANFKTHDLTYWFKCLTYHLLKDINKVRMTNKLIHPKLLSANQKKLLQRIADNVKKDIEYIQNEYNYIDCITNFIKESFKEMN